MSDELALEPETIGARVRMLRKRRGLSQKQLSEKVGVHYTHISRYERGQSRPSADGLKRLANVLGVSVDYLLEGTKEEAAKATFDDRELLRMFKEVEQLPADEKAVVKTFLDAFLVKKQLEALVSR